MNSGAFDKRHVEMHEGGLPSLDGVESSRELHRSSSSGNQIHIEPNRRMTP